MSNQLPYTISGYVYDTDGSTPVNGATVRARNETNNEIIFVTSNSPGEYVIDCANFASGYLLTDKVTVYVIYTNLEASATIDISEDEHTANLTLTTVADSSLIYYCTIQDVYDMMDLTESDLTAQKIIKAIQRSEARIEERTQTTFKSTTTTEYYDFNKYNSFMSPEQMEDRGFVGRRDSWNINYRNKFRLNHYPVISITTLWKNSAAANQADSWTSLTEQTGSGGDYECDDDTGWVTFIDDLPRTGKRAVKVTYAYGYSTAPKQVERLTIFLAVSDLIRMRVNSSQFDNTSSINMADLSISNSAGANAVYFDNLQKSIDEAWGEVGILIADLT